MATSQPSMTGIQSVAVNQLPVAVIDVETTGLNHHDRIIEISVVRVDPDGEPRLVFDSLVNPGRAIRNSDIHGISDEDVANAPAFMEIAPAVHNALEGCVVAAHNAYFDMRFLNKAFSGCGLPQSELPFFCLMYLRPMLGLGKRCTLQMACEAEGLSFQEQHQASADALAAAACWIRYREKLAACGVETFGEFARLRRYKFQESFVLSPASGRLPATASLTRSRESSPVDPITSQRRQYWSLLATLLSDLVISKDDLLQAVALRESLSMSREQIRSVHARVFAAVIAQFAEDHWLDDKEARKLRRLYDCLSRLGWAPGQ